MFNRQKNLLSMIQQAGRPVQRMELTNWAFVLRNETQSQGGPAFFDFVPYHSGPFSFSLRQEAAKLESLGYIASDGETLTLGSMASPRLDDRQTSEDIVSVIKRYATLSTEALRDYVFKRYPEFTAVGERKRLVGRSKAEFAVYTSGYEGLSIDGFLNRLSVAGIRHLIDVRCNPIARRYGFHKSTLKQLCENLDIRYSHSPEVGIRSEKRQSLESQDDYDELFKDYRKTTLKNEHDAIQRLSEWVQESPSVLVCMEAEPCRCHRSHLAEVISKQTKLPVHHLISQSRVADD